jgi:hypothetical protein
MSPRSRLASQHRLSPRSRLASPYRNRLSAALRHAGAYPVARRSSAPHPTGAEKASESSPGWGAPPLIAGVTCTSPSCSRPGRQQIAGPDPTEDRRPQPSRKFKEIKLFNSPPGFLIPISSRAPRRQQETGGGGGGERTPSPEHTPQCDSPSALQRIGENPHQYGTLAYSTHG